MAMLSSISPPGRQGDNDDDDDGGGEDDEGEENLNVLSVSISGGSTDQYKVPTSAKVQKWCKNKTNNRNGGWTRRWVDHPALLPNVVTGDRQKAADQSQ